MLGQYILDDDHHPIEENDPLKWAEWMGSNKKKRFCKQEKINEYFVSTVFLGIDHSFNFLYADGSTRTPVLFETMIFKGDDSVYMNRYETFDQAIEGHAKAIEMAKEGKFKDE